MSVLARPQAALAPATAKQSSWHGLLQRKMRVGAGNDALELEADRVADRVMAGQAPTSLHVRPVSVQRASPGTGHHHGYAPPSVGQSLAHRGMPLQPALRRDMEQRFGHDFSHVRVHTGPLAERSARDVGARAYTVGRDVVFNSSEYAPGTRSGRRLIAHELSHVLQQGARGQGSAAALLQRDKAAPVPREDYVFIMGQDPRRSRNRFYTLAERYFRAHIPGATFVTNIRNLSDLLDYLVANVHRPVGNLYIVSHANEDGTLSFGLDSADADAHLSVQELRTALHPAAGGASALPAITNQIDARTRIHIKGCDLGRTQEMVELLDEAFGGAGTVTAPTHEQWYTSDRTLAARARRRFRSGIEAGHAMPAAVDPALRGRARRRALAQRRRALRRRRADIRAEIRARRAEEDVIVRRAGIVESLRGPMFQRPGTHRYTAAELTPEVNRLYGHLSARRRRRLVRRLVARDRRGAAAAARNGVVGQHGQRVYRHTTFRLTFPEPATVAEANRAFAADFRSAHYRAIRLLAPESEVVGDEIEYSFETEGRIRHGRRRRSEEASRINTVSRPTDASLLSQGRAQLSNPHRYAWRIQRRHARNGRTTLRVIAERVIAYLHHGSLNPAAHEYFTREESDTDFYATSTFAPPPPPARPAP